MGEMVPDGRYQVSTEFGSRRLVMVDGRRVRSLAADGTSPGPLRGMSASSALELIARDRVAAAVDYAVTCGRCCVCGRQLKAAESLSRSIGPVCLEKFGVAFGVAERDRMLEEFAERSALRLHDRLAGVA